MSKIILAKHREKSSVGWNNLSPDVTPKVLKRVGQPEDQEPQFLAAGSKGSIYMLQSGKILKLTSDAGEAHAASIVKDNPNPNIYQVLDAFEIESEDPLFGILLEYLEPADPEWVEFGDIFNSWHTNMTNAMDARHPGQHTYIYLLPPIMKVFKKYIEDGYGPDRFKQQLKWLTTITEYLLENKILFLDVHGGNIMKKPNSDQHVLIDIGYSETPPVEMDKITAKVDRYIIAKKLVIMAEILLQEFPQN